MLSLRGSCRVVSLLALLASCGDSDGSGTSWTVRVLHESAPAADEAATVFSDELDSLDGWMVLVPGAKGAMKVVPAASRVRPGGLVHEAGRVVLPAGVALMRRVDIEQSREHAFTVRMRGTVAQAGDHCPNLFFLKATTPSGASFFDSPLPRREELAALAEELRDGAAGTSAVWRDPVDEQSFAQARWLGWTSAEVAGGSSRMLVIAALDRPLEVDRVQLTMTPRLNRGSDSGTEVATASDGVVIERVKLGGDARMSAVVPAGRRLSVPLEVPPGAVDLALGVGPDPAAAALAGPGGSRWRVAVQPGDRTLGEGSLTPPGDGQPARFTDQLLAWPQGVHGAVTLEFSAEVGRGVIFGQPILRGPEPPAARPETPSLLLVSIDTLRADHLGFMGYPRPTSPYLDELARSGIVFTDVSAVSSYTLPTHASLFTGVFPPRHLALDTSDRLNTARMPTLAMRLASAGYATAGFTGGGFLSMDYGFADGFDSYSMVDPVSVSREGLGAVADWIAQQGRRPWFAFVHTYATHEYDPPAEDLALFERAPPDPGFVLRDLLNEHRDLHALPPTPAELDRLTDLYDACIHHVDRSLRALIEPLRERGLLDDACIVVTSDHGEEFFEHGHLRHRGSLYEELLRVPLLIVPPRLAQGRRVAAAVSQVDILPTLAELLHLPAPAELDGHSLAAAAGGEAPSGAPTALYSQLDRSYQARAALRCGPWKLVRTDRHDAGDPPSADGWELFDLEHDPHELHDLAVEGRVEFDLIRRRLDEVEAAMHEHPGVRTRLEPDAELLRSLSALGYVETSR
ncbi:MAG TPA: sulfatase [Planctomycetota bacterium]|nr:sulfatase [Planctomycetota bacterium]